MPSCTSIPTSLREDADSSSWSSISFQTASDILSYEVAVNQPPHTIDGDDNFQLSCYAAQNLALANWIWLQKAENSDSSDVNLQSGFRAFKHIFQPLKPLRQWLDNLTIHDRIFAHKLCALIPAQCPFERDVKVLGKTLFHIPPLCKLNPIYDELVYLRFRAMSYLADECGEDVSIYA